MDVLVTAATGRLGRPLVAHLLDRGHHVRALTRNPASPAASALAQQGAVLERGDLDDPGSLRAVLGGADVVFLATTPHNGAGPAAEVRRSIALADAAADAGIGYLVYSSAAGADQPNGVAILQSKRHVEDHLRALGIRHAVLAPVYFMENLHYPWNAAVLRAGRWPIPLPVSRPVQLVAVHDLAAVAARVIERPADFATNRLEVAADELTGPEAAKIAADALGHPVVHDETVPEQLAGMVPLFRWIAEVGFHADIPQLRRSFPDIAWQSLADWAAAQDWNDDTKPPINAGS
jgi:uncharacterized protein YbjT (DUF2867 family)